MASAREERITCNCLRKIRIAGKILLLDDDRMAQPPRGIAELENAKASIATVHAENRHALQAKFGEDAARQRQALHAVILQDR